MPHRSRPSFPRCVLAALCLSAAPGAHADPPTVDRVVERYIAAIGGRDNVKALRNLVYSAGLYEEGDYRGAGKATMSVARPYYKLVGSHDEPGGYMEGYDGSAWEWFADPGVVVRTVGAASEAIRHYAGVESPLVDFRAKGSTASIKGETLLDGRPVVVVELTRRDGFVEQFYVDRDSWLIVASSAAAPIHAFGSEVLSLTRISDYREVAGVRIPHRFASVGMPSGRELSSMQWGKIEANRDLPAGWFSPPEFERTPLQRLVEDLYGQRADIEAVMWTYHEFRRAHPGTDVGSAVHFAGYQMLKMGGVDQAITLLEQNVRDHPASADGRFGLGRALRAAGRLEEARDEFEQALRVDPGHAAARQALAEAGPLGTSARSGLPFSDDFEGDLSRWEVNDGDAIAIIDSGDERHGRVLRLRPEHSTLYALIRGSDNWGAYRLEGEVLFPTDEHNYLGFVYNLRDRNGRIDLGSLYIKGNGSYVRVNPRRDWNPARMLYEEFRVELTGDAAIEIGRWQRFALEVEGAVCHLYVADMETPKVTFPHLEHDSGRAGFKPRVVGGPVWLDNVRATAIEGLRYHGPLLPAGIEYRPERMVRDWQVLGPFRSARTEVERRAEPARGGTTEAGVEHHWREFDTDPRGAVVTGRVVDFLGENTVAYFYTRIEVPAGRRAELEFSTIDEMAIWLNGEFAGYRRADRFAWHDFEVNPDHPRTPYSSLRLVEGTNHVLIRIRGGRYASGGFFAAVDHDRGQPPPGP